MTFLLIYLLCGAGVALLVYSKVKEIGTVSEIIRFMDKPLHDKLLEFHEEARLNAVLTGLLLLLTVLAWPLAIYRMVRF